jgi:bifunctional N-acetylglucosamine-1-phosphate-uridyltransferase/glucosamine-1-phosphate-acetyltransferase GlmU-like protein
LHGIPLIVWVIANFTFEKEDTLFIVGRSNCGIDLIVNEYCQNLDLDISYLFLDRLTDGAARTVDLAAERLAQNQPMIVANSDQYISKSIDQYLQISKSKLYDGTVMTMSANSNKWSYVLTNHQDEILQIEEKKEISNDATVGIYGWTKVSDFRQSFLETVRYKQTVNGEYYLAPTYNNLIKNGKKIKKVDIGAVDKVVHGLGTPDDFQSFKINPISVEEAQKIKIRLKII